MFWTDVFKSDLMTRIIYSKLIANLLVWFNEMDHSMPGVEMYSPLAEG